MDLSTLQKQLSQHQGKSPPVEKWDPDFCGDIDMVIKHDGSWFYMGTPIGRKALVKLFSSVLKKQQDDYFLVTPVEKVGITVEDVPFIITQWRQEDDLLVLTTQTEDQLIISEQHPVKLQADACSGDILPYVLVRRNLWARLHQNVFYQLVEMGQQTMLDGKSQLVLQSGDYSFSLGYL